MKIVPINAENIDFIRLDLSRHYIQIDCDFVCYIVLNPSGTIPVGGTDVCAFHVGAWQVDAWKFLTKDFAQIPGFSACLVWDRTLVTELSKAPQVAESDIDTANSISSLKGQPVNITGFSLAEGESLKVSTLDEEFVSVKEFPGAEFPICSKIHQVSVGDIFDESYFTRCFYKIDSDYVYINPRFLYTPLSTGRFKSLTVKDLRANVPILIPSGFVAMQDCPVLFDKGIIKASVVDGVITSINVLFNFYWYSSTDNLFSINESLDSVFVY